MGKKYRILIADDEEDIKTVMSMVLESEGYESLLLMMALMPWIKLKMNCQTLFSLI